MTKKFQLLMTSDSHANYIPSEKGTTLFNTAGAIQSLRKRSEIPSLTIDLGDFIQGSILSTYTSSVINQGVVFADGMNAVGYDYQILGNHEFNYDRDYYEQIFRRLKSQILAANIVDLDGNQAFGKAYDIIELNDIKVGIIGLTTSIVPHWEQAKHIEGLIFLDAFESLKEYAEEIRQQVDVFIVAYHGSLGNGNPEDIENQGLRMIKEIPGIDILLTAHMHLNLCEYIGGTLVVQAGYAGESIVEIEIEVDEESKVMSHGKLHRAQDYPEDKHLENCMNPTYSNAKSWANAVVGNLGLKSVDMTSFEARIKGHPFIEWMNQLQLQATGADFSATSLINDHFVNFKGDIRNKQIVEAFPFHNHIATVELSGYDLKQAMEYNLSYLKIEEGLLIEPIEIEGQRPSYLNYDIYSGINLLIDPKRPLGHRVIEMRNKNDGSVIQDNMTYTLALTQFRASGGRGYEKWFNVDRFVNVSEDSMIELVYKALQGDINIDIDKVNEDYQWLKGK